MATDKPNDDPPKIIVDDDWKQQAQAEKEKLAEQETKESSSGRAQAGPIPKADVTTLISSFLSQALFAMGAIEHPELGRSVDLDLAKFNIDMLAVLEEKTKGNLTQQEERMLNQAIHQARMAFVEVASSQSGPVG